MRRLDEISYGPKRNFRLLSHRWLTAAVTAATLAAAAALAITGISEARGAGAPGTFLVTCAMANWSQLNPGWRSSSLRVGSLWFVDSNLSGYVRDGSSPNTAGAVAGSAETSTDATIPLEVAAGSTVVMKAAPGTQSYFRFLTGFGAGTGYQLPSPLPSGDTGFTFVACPRQHVGPNGLMTDFLLGFSIDPSRTARVEIRTSASPRPVWITLAGPAGTLSSAATTSP